MKFTFTQEEAQHLTDEELASYIQDGLIDGIPMWLGKRIADLLYALEHLDEV